MSARFTVRDSAHGFGVEDAQGEVRVVLQGAEAGDREAAQHYADRLNELSAAEVTTLARAAAESPPAAVDVDEAGLPTVTGYRQLYLAALAQLEVDEPTWGRKRREQVARSMTEAYCQGAIERASREAAGGPAANNASRFEPVLMPTGWSVVDVEAEAVIEPRRPWDRPTAEAVAAALAALPDYAVLFTWSTLLVEPAEHDQVPPHQAEARAHALESATAVEAWT